MTPVARPWGPRTGTTVRLNVFTEAGHLLSPTNQKIYALRNTIQLMDDIGKASRKSMDDHNAASADRLGLLSEALTEAVSIFRRLDDAGRATLLKTLSTLFEITNTTEAPAGPRTVAYAEPVERFSKEQSLSPKEFLFKKQPRTDVERVACLAYYLAHYRNQPHFKNTDIKALNTEAAQRQFSNAAVSVSNAAKLGYLAQGTKGAKQLSASGEMYVEALPDREAANSALKYLRPKRTSRKKAQSKKVG